MFRHFIMVLMVTVLAFIFIGCLPKQMDSGVMLYKDSAVMLYVAVDGDDSNPGTLEKPFATLYAVRDKVRKHNQSGLKGNIQIFLRGGTYYLDRPLTFTHTDGGNHEYEVVYAAYPGEQVVLSGGCRITGWVQGKNDMWKAELPDVKNGQWFFRQLYADGQRLSRGRYPEFGFLKINERSDDFMKLKLNQAVPFGDMSQPANRCCCSDCITGA